jgi:hypothetical protein
MNFATLTEIAIYLAGGFNHGLYEQYAMVQHQLNYELNNGVFKNE